MPTHTLRFLLPSRYCEVDRLNRLFQHVFFVDDDRRAYLGILAEETAAANVTAVHIGQATSESFPDDLISATGFKPSPEWKVFLRQADDPRDITALRRATQTGRPPAGDSTMSKFEKLVGRLLRALPPGRPRKNTTT